MSIPSLNKVKRRMATVTVCAVCALAFLAAKTAYWQIVKGSELAEKAKAQQQGTSVITASRGKIYDRNGKVLAESATVNTLICNPQDIGDKDEPGIIARELAGILNMDSGKILKLLTQNNRYQVIKKRLTTEETDAVRSIMNGSKGEETARAFNGIYFENDSKRYYPFSIAPHILGFTGYDNNGLQGIELMYDSELSGKAGSVKQNQTARGETLNERSSENLTKPETGGDVVLTIDETIQHFLEKHLEEAVVEDKLKEGAAGIIMNPKTGEILAMATKPDFDVNDPYDITRFDKYSIDFRIDGEENKTDDPDASPTPTEDPKKMSDEKIAAMRNKMWRNKVVSDSYEPGSTFKIITAAAALEEHVVDLDTPFYCPGFRIIEDRTIQCASTVGHGPETFVEGVENSCNPVFMDLGLKLGQDKFMEYFAAFGLTQKTDIQLSGEASSIYYRNTMSNVDLATSSFGQGFQITPIQLITAVSAVINGGERMKPQIVKEIRNGSGVIKTYEPEIVNRVISEETSAKMRTILEGVVSKPEATGKNAYVPGCRIGGKTGTSEKQPRGSDKRVASFIGFAPANDPEVVCLIVLDEPQIDNKFGGTIAAPIAGEVIEDVLNYLGIDKQYSKNDVFQDKSEVPDIRDMDVEEARKAIVDAGLKYKTEGDGETVNDQLPKPGVVINQGSTVILYTEEIDRDDLVTVPDLIGMTEDVAKDMLNNRNLNFETVGAGHSSAYNAYSVKQSIPAGEEVLPGTVVGVEFRQVATD